MRIGIDGHVLGKNIGGVERYVEKLVELVPSLCPQHEFLVFTTARAPVRFSAGRRGNVEFVQLPVSNPIVQRSVLLPWAVRKYRLDLLQVQRVAPWACGPCRLALTIHDLIPLKYPGQYKGLQNRLVRLLTPGSVGRADLILCPTQSVCDDIMARFPGTRAPLRVFYNGVDPQLFSGGGSESGDTTLNRLGVTGRFVFSPGAIEPRKNLETLIRAISLLDTGTRPLLVLSGSIRDPRYFAQMRGLATELGVAEWVRHLGFIADEDLVRLYGLAEVCVAASIEEGFNLLPLEAMACGAPVFCSDIAVHRELYHPGARFFPTGCADVLAQMMREILQDTEMRAVMNKDAQACLNRLSWGAMARNMAKFFDECLAVRKRPYQAVGLA